MWVSSPGGKEALGGTRVTDIFSDTAVVVATAPNIVMDLVSEDMDQDGQRDLLVIDHLTGTVQWHRAVDAAQRQFVPVAEVGQIGVGGAAVLAANIINPASGFLDVVAATAHDRVMLFTHINGRGAYDDGLELRVARAASPFSSAIVSLAVQTVTPGSQLLDIFVANSLTGSVYWFQNLDGLGSFTSAISLDPVSSLRFLAVGDGQLFLTTTTDFRIFGGSRHELDTASVAASHSPPSKGPLCRTQTAGPFFAKCVSCYSYTEADFTCGDAAPYQAEFSPLSQSSASFSALAAADIDGDGDMDLAALRHLSTGFRLHWVENTDGRGLFSTLRSVDNPALAGGGTRLLVFANITGGALLDLVWVRQSTIFIYRNSGAGSLTSKTGGPEYTPVSSTPIVAAAVGDVSGDGMADIVYVDGSATQRIVYLRNTGTRTSLFTASTVATVDGVSSLALGDVNGDGDMDIVAARGAKGLVLAYLRRTVPRFSLLSPWLGVSVTSTGASALPTTLLTMDRDLDGDDDVYYGTNTGKVMVCVSKAQQPRGVLGGGSQDYTNDPFDSVVCTEQFSRVGGGAGGITALLPGDRTSSSSRRFQIGIIADAVTSSDMFSLQTVQRYAFFSSLTTVITDISDDVAFTRAAMADVDGDGDVDVLAVSSMANRLMVLRNNRIDSTPPVLVCDQSRFAETFSTPLVLDDGASVVDIHAAVAELVVASDNTAVVGREWLVKQTQGYDTRQPQLYSLHSPPPKNTNWSLPVAGNSLQLPAGRFVIRSVATDPAGTSTTCLLGEVVVEDHTAPIITTCARNVLRFSRDPQTGLALAPDPADFATFQVGDNSFVEKVEFRTGLNDDPRTTWLDNGFYNITMRAIDAHGNFAQCYLGLSVVEPKYGTLEWEAAVPIPPASRLQLQQGTFVRLELFAVPQLHRDKVQEGRYAVAALTSLLFGMALSASTSVAILSGAPLASGLGAAVIQICDTEVVANAAEGSPDEVACARLRIGFAVAKFTIEWQGLGGGGRRRREGEERGLTAHPMARREATANLTLPAAVLGQAYEYEPPAVVVVGGSSCITYSVNAGELPPGLTLADTGRLSGVPSASGQRYAFQLLASDASGVQAVVGDTFLEMEVADCGAASCAHGGVCVDATTYDGLFSCTCSGLWEGPTCEDEILCPAGTEEQAQACVNCVAGTTDADVDGKTACVACAAGTYVPAKSFGACSTFTCPAGTTDHDANPTTPCVGCSAGTYAPANSTVAACASCAAGKTDHDSDPSTPCVDCSAGGYVPAGSVGDCAGFVCAAGTTDHDSNPATACAACGVGHYTRAGESGPCSSFQCDFANVDHDADPATPCRALCGAGHHVTPGAFGACSKYLCPAGTTDADGDPSTACVSCGSGVYAPTGASGSCASHACPAGTLDTDSSAATACVSCPAGTYVPAGQAAASCAAYDCSSGAVDHDGNAATPCIVLTEVIGCSNGNKRVINPDGSQVCQPCAAGTVDTTGDQDDGLCQSCGAGHHVPAGSYGTCADYACPAGTSDVVGLYA